MAIYSQAQLTTIATTTQPSWSCLATSANSPKMMEFFLNLGAATQSTYGLGRPGNDGSFTQTAGLAVLAENPADPTGNTTTAVAWGTAPTVPTTFFRRAFLQAVIGTGIIFTFPRGLTIAASHGLTLWNIAASSASTHVHLVVDE